MALAYLLGLSAGIVPALSTGPVFLTLVQHAMDHGFRKAIYFIVGVAMTDASIVLITWMGWSQVSGAANSPAWLSVVGGVFLLVFGVVFICRKAPETQEKAPTKTHRMHALVLFAQAVTLSGINPVVWAFWATLSSYAIKTLGNTTEVWLFFAGVLNMIWVTDMLKAYYAQKLKKYLTERVKRYIKGSIGVVLIVFGLRLILQYYFYST